MATYAFIPARGGSKRIPRKNLASVGGRSLLARAIDAAAPCDFAVVSTDDAEIADRAAKLGAIVHLRPPNLAGDHAQIEDAIGHWWRRLVDYPDAVVLLQPTSPFRTAEHVREALELLSAPGVDSVVGVLTEPALHFAGRLKSVEIEGHHLRLFTPYRSLDSRPRTQDVEPRGIETGALYAFTRAHWERTHNRMGGRCVGLPMDRWASHDIDTPQDLADAQAHAARISVTYIPTDGPSTWVLT